MGKRKLLYISTRIPESSGGGSQMRAASHIKVLCELFDVTLAIVGDLGSETEVYKRLPADMRRACVSILIVSRISVINRLLRRTRSARARALFEAVWPTPAWSFAPSGPALAELGRRLSGERFDVVHCFRLNTGLLRSMRRYGIIFGRSVLDFDDYESQAEFRSSKTFRRLIGKKLTAVSWLNGVKWWVLESRLIPSFDDALVCSEFDRQGLLRRFPGVHWHVLPNTIAEPPEAHPVGCHPFTFLFVGILDYLPNYDAVVFFCTRVLPLLRQDAPGEFRALIVGRRSYELSELAAIEEVLVVLNPPDVAPYYAKSDAVIVPLRSGSGTRVKILEAFSYGLPVVSTTIGAHGLDVTPGSNIIIADGAQDFAEQCLRIWRDEPLRRQIGTGGRDLWLSKYTSAALNSALNTLYGESRPVSTPLLL